MIRLQDYPATQGENRDCTQPSFSPSIGRCHRRDRPAARPRPHHCREWHRRGAYVPLTPLRCASGCHSASAWQRTQPGNCCLSISPEHAPERPPSPPQHARPHELDAVRCTGSLSGRVHGRCRTFTAPASPASSLLRAACPEQPARAHTAAHAARRDAASS